MELPLEAKCTNEVIIIDIKAATPHNVKHV